VSAPRGFVPIAQAAASMGLSIAEALKFATTINGEPCVPESVMRDIAVARNAAAQAEQREYAEGRLESGERKF
jgi:hypothetical protein